MAGGATPGTLSRPAAAVALIAVLALSGLVGIVLSTSGSVSAAPWAGPEPTPTNLTVFLHNSSTALPIVGGLFSTTVLSTSNDSARPWTGEGRVDRGLHFLTVPFYLFPRLAGSLVINGTPEANVYVNQTGSTTTGAWTFSLYSVSPSGNLTLLGTPGKTSYASGFNGNLALPLTIVYGSMLHVTLSPGWSLEASFAQTQGATADWYGFWWGDVGGTYYAGDLNLPASSYLAVDAAFLVNSAGRTVSNLNTSGASMVVSLRANLTDPLGNYDFDNWSVNWSVANFTGVPQGGGPMSPIAPTVPPMIGGYNETYAASFNYSKLATGGYVLCVNATDNTYHNDLLFTGHYYGRLAEGCTPFTVGLGPNPLRITVVDDRGLALAGALVVISEVANHTDGSGHAVFHLVNGTYAGTVIWEAVTVASFTATVAGATNDTVAASVDYPTFAIEDQDGAPLADAFVTLVHPNGTELPLIVTNQTGEIPLLRVPAGSWGLTVVWRDTVVYTQPPEPAIKVNGSGMYAVRTEVFTESFRVVESGGTPIALASVLVEDTSTGVLLSFGITNSSGETSARLPAGTYTLVVYWQQGAIATISGFEIPAAENPYVVSASLFSVTFLAKDSRGLPVASAIIGVTGPGGPVTNLLTSSAGSAAAVLPGGTYTLTTLWDGVTVNTTTVVLSASENLTLGLSIYYLTVATLDSNGAALTGVELEVLSPSTGTVIASATSTSQPSEFRLPTGTYEIAGSFRGTYDLTPVEQSLNITTTLQSSETVTLRFTEAYPAFTSTNEFYVIVGYAFLAILLIALLVVAARRRAGPPGPRDPSPSRRPEANAKATDTTQPSHP